MWPASGEIAAVQKRTTLEQTECMPGNLSLALLQMDFMPLLRPESPMPCKKTTGT